MDESSWVRNAKDCIITFEVDAAIQASIDKLGLREQCDFQNTMFWPVLQTMIRGVRIDLERRASFAAELGSEIDRRNGWLAEICGHPLNPRSPLQMKRFFYEDLRQPPIKSRKAASKGNLTLDDEALQKIAFREPLLRPIVRRIRELRSLGVFLSTFVEAQLDSDNRLRCSYNLAGTETFRLSSSKNAFGNGANLQNIPKGGEADDEVEPLELPNIKTLFVPDPGYTFFDGDLDRADLQVVVWEADDAELRDMLRAGVDLHIENAKLLFDTRDPSPAQRQVTKRWVHGTDYGGGSRTMATNCGLTVHQSDKMRTRWFTAHPGIPAWQARTAEQLSSKRYVENRFGFRRYYFDRVEGLLPQALAWIPQSTVAHYINRIWLSVYRELPEMWVLLQVHDSLAGQYPTDRPELLDKLAGLAARVVVPYPDPLVIPFSVKTSPISWGDCA